MLEEITLLIIGSLIGGFLRPFAEEAADTVMQRYKFLIQGAKMSPEELKQECREIHEDLTRLSVDNRVDYGSIDKDEAELIQESSKSQERIMNRYNQRYASRVETLLAEFEQRDIDVSNVRSMHRNPINSAVIRNIGSDILEYAERVE